MDTTIFEQRQRLRGVAVCVNQFEAGVLNVAGKHGNARIASQIAFLLQ